MSLSPKMTKSIQKIKMELYATIKYSKIIENNLKFKKNNKIELYKLRQVFTFFQIKTLSILTWMKNR